MKRTMNQPDTEPDQKKEFLLPSEKEHVFQIVDFIGGDDNADIVVTKLEVCSGDEVGRTMLHRVSLDEQWKGFFLTRLFLKCIGEPYKGAFDMDTDMWIGKRFVASVVHSKANNGKIYANIDKFNPDASMALSAVAVGVEASPNDIKWEE